MAINAAITHSSGCADDTVTPALSGNDRKTGSAAYSAAYQRHLRRPADLQSSRLPRYFRRCVHAREACFQGCPRGNGGASFVTSCAAGPRGVYRHRFTAGATTASAPPLTERVSMAPPLPPPALSEGRHESGLPPRCYVARNGPAMEASAPPTMVPARTATRGRAVPPVPASCRDEIMLLGILARRPRALHERAERPIAVSGPCHSASTAPT